MAGEVDFNTLTPEARRKALEQMSPEERAKFEAAGPIPAPRKSSSPAKASAPAPAKGSNPGTPAPEESPAPPVPAMISRDVTSRGDGFGLVVGLALLFLAFMWLDNVIKPTLILAVAVTVGIGAIFPPLAVGILGIAFLYSVLTHGLPVVGAFQNLFAKANAPENVNPIQPNRPSASGGPSGNLAPV